ncbi:hypothetical protein CTA2_2010 [Colletotrichum tanaceti]|nr:hypothetical protein CTA2_2010 [Colletotrichum tanaceti]
MSAAAAAADVYRRQLDSILLPGGVQHRAVAGHVDHSRDGESRFAEILAVLVVGTVLSTAAVALRAFTRLRMLRTFGLDDAVMVVAQVGGIGSTTYSQRARAGGLALGGKSIAHHTVLLATRLW